MLLYYITPLKHYYAASYHQDNYYYYTCNLHNNSYNYKLVKMAEGEKMSEAVKHDCPDKGHFHAFKERVLHSCIEIIGLIDGGLY